MKFKKVTIRRLGDFTNTDKILSVLRTITEPEHTKDHEFEENAHWHDTCIHCNWIRPDRFSEIGLLHRAKILIKLIESPHKPFETQAEFRKLCALIERSLLLVPAKELVGATALMEFQFQVEAAKVVGLSHLVNLVDEAQGTLKNVRKTLSEKFNLD